MSYRETGKKALNLVLKSQKNITVIEKYVNAASEDEDDYLQNIYQVIGDIMSKKRLKPILADVKEQKLGWNHECFDEIVAALQEQDDFIENPFEVEEGVLECQKCGSKRVFSYSKQCRSADEGYSTFATCVQCKTKWTMRG